MTILAALMPSKNYTVGLRSDSPLEPFLTRLGGQ